MTKKLTKHGENLALIIDKAMLHDLGITEKTELQIIVVGSTLIIQPKKIKSQKMQEKKLKAMAEAIMDHYEPVFKKLAKS